MSHEELLNVRSVEDILAYLPHAVGYWPDQSFVVVTLRGNQVGATLRLDLPARDPDPEWCRLFAEVVISQISADVEADGTVVALFAGRDWLDDEDPGYDELMAAVWGMLASIGKPLHEAWYVGEEHWRDYLCRDAQCCPVQGRPLSAVRNSLLNAELVYRGSSYLESLSEAVQLPVASVQMRRAAKKFFDLALVRMATTMPGERVHREALSSWESVLDGSQSLADSSERLGYLTASLVNRGIRDALMVSAVAGLDQGFRVGDESGAPGDPDLSVTSVAMGEWPGPEWERVNRLADGLERVAGLGGMSPTVRVPRTLSLREPVAAALTLLGWIEWCRGRGSRSGVRLTQALEICPDYRLAHLLLQVLDSGMQCPWVRDPLTAWQRPSPHAA
ncbi:DUF4192 domain-containing protein [Psychromicrobium xiongbiense]|uniref:DUF4192 domain-containing protein n=1 Tax=Psychromicrobium xiongbiense TaxID=3051184 RepID=UPI002552F7E5|nr:DUF4192 domain-containing protein [Psychromicrobium sp. YIM S02556]